MDKMQERVQKELCEKFGMDYHAPEQMVAIALGTIGQMPIYGTRVQSSEGDNISWFFYCGEYSDDESFYSPIHTVHLNELLPEVIPYLSLPQNIKFIIDDQGYEDIWKGMPLDASERICPLTKSCSLKSNTSRL